MANRGRKVKITPSDVQDFLEEEEYIPTADLAFLLDVCKATIRKNIRLLKEAGVPIIHGLGGLRLMGTKEELANDEDAQKDMRYYIRWTHYSMKALVMAAIPIKKYFPILKRVLREKYTPVERKQLASQMLKIAYLITAIDIEE